MLVVDAVLERKHVRRVDDDDVATMLSRVVSEYAEGAPYYDAGGRFSLAGALVVSDTTAKA